MIEGKVIMDITLSSSKDKQPLQMVSGEQVEKWRAIERVARRLVHNGHLLSEGPLRTLLNNLVVVLAMPSVEEEATKAKDQEC